MNFCNYTRREMGRHDMKMENGRVGNGKIENGRVGNGKMEEWEIGK